MVFLLVVGVGALGMHYLTSNDPEAVRVRDTTTGAVKKAVENVRGSLDSPARLFSYDTQTGALSETPEGRFVSMRACEEERERRLSNFPPGAVEAFRLGYKCISE